LTNAGYLIKQRVIRTRNGSRLQVAGWRLEVV
jgi:hypothetical protein